MLVEAQLHEREEMQAADAQAFKLLDEQYQNLRDRYIDLCSTQSGCGFNRRNTQHITRNTPACSCDTDDPPPALPLPPLPPQPEVIAAADLRHKAAPNAPTDDSIDLRHKALQWGGQQALNRVVEQQQFVEGTEHVTGVAAGAGGDGEEGHSAADLVRVRIAKGLSRGSIQADTLDTLASNQSSK